jgi:hypothetical protein
VVVVWANAGVTMKSKERKKDNEIIIFFKILYTSFQNKKTAR